MLWTNRDLGWLWLLMESPCCTAGRSRKITKSCWSKTSADMTPHAPHTRCLYGRLIVKLETMNINTSISTDSRFYAQVVLYWICKQWPTNRDLYVPR